MAGGIVGDTTSTVNIKNCIFAGEVSSTGGHGGISGKKDGTYTNCYYSADSCVSDDNDTKVGTALSMAELASLTAGGLDNSDAWDMGKVTDLTETDPTYHIYKMDYTLPKLKIMKNAVTGSAEVYNFGIDGKNDYQEFTAIKSVDDLKNIEDNITGNYVIMVDKLDASSMELLSDFSGKLAGNGCEISLTKPLFGNNSGLVMGINASGTIEISNDYTYGAIACYNDGGTIYACSFSGSLTSNGYTGGICGESSGGVIRKCYNTGSITAKSNAGGIVGLSSATISECYNTGSVNGKEDIGGIVGDAEQHSKISNCYNTGRITGEKNVGGIVGIEYNDVAITNVLNAGIVYASDPVNYGCILGVADSITYTNCYFIAELSATNYNGKGEGISIGDIATLNLGSAWNKGTLGALSEADGDGFKSQEATLPSLNGVGTARTAEAYQFNFKVNPSDKDNWLYTTRVTTVDELQTACPTGNIALADDIVFTDSDPAFIAFRIDRSGNNSNGYFSGNGHTIKNMKLKGDKNSTALFENSYGVIMDLTMGGRITVSDARSAAPFCIYNYGTIIRCHNAADISGSFNIGALSAGKTYGISSDTYNINNSYYLSANPGKDGLAKTEAEFESGKVAYLLNGDQSTIAWGQEIGKDKYPVIGGMRVYGSSPCQYLFKNENSDLNKEHVYEDGKCKNCGEIKAPSKDENGYYLLGSKAELMWFAQEVNSGSTDINAKLTADITLNENVLDKNGELADGNFESWEPIGTGYVSYKGIFDGNGHTISGIYGNTAQRLYTYCAVRFFVRLYNEDDARLSPC